MKAIFVITLAALIFSAIQLNVSEDPLLKWQASIDNETCVKGFVVQKLHFHRRP